MLKISRNVENYFCFCIFAIISVNIPFVVKSTSSPSPETPLGIFNEKRYAPENTCRFVVSLRTVMVSFFAGTAPILIMLSDALPDIICDSIFTSPLT